MASSMQSMICSDPQIWVYDDLLSEALLQAVDQAFDEVQWKMLNGRQVRIVQLTIDGQLNELTTTLSKISHIDEILPCSKAWVMDVVGRDQDAHMDGWDMSKNSDSLNALDMSKYSLQSHKGFKTIIPTLSFVIYFNDVGGCTFPYAAMADKTIPARRGRILMFHNYAGSQRPDHNPAAMHFGVYGDTPKRVMTAGMLSNETPPELLAPQHGHGLKTKGFLYAPIMHKPKTSCGDPASPRSPPRSPSPVHKQVIQLSACWVDGKIDVEAIVEARYMSGELLSRVKFEKKTNATLASLRQALGLNRHVQFVHGAEFLSGLDGASLFDALLKPNLLQSRDRQGKTQGGQSSGTKLTKTIDVDTLIELDGEADLVYSQLPCSSSASEPFVRPLVDRTSVGSGGAGQARQLPSKPKGRR